ncbi:MAG: class I SAM-dependent methyltransferase [Pseudobdellovibrionaceae bacterium]
MSRLDSFIRRTMAQRDCLNFVIPQIKNMKGPIFELGLGNGRTYDHLREHLPGRDIYVFERKIAAHPDCIPPEDRLFLGDIGETYPRALAKFKKQAALTHTDLGTGDREALVELSKFLGPAIANLTQVGGFVVANIEMNVPELQRLPEPDGVPKDRYYIYKVIG